MLTTAGLVGFAPLSWVAPSTPSTVSSAAAPVSATGIPEPPPLEEARTQLDELTVSPEDDVPGYSRAEFPHWATQ